MGEFLRDGQDRHHRKWSGHKPSDNFCEDDLWHTQVFQSKINQNLRADAAFVLEQALPCGIAVEGRGSDRIFAAPRQGRNYRL